MAQTFRNGPRAAGGLIVAAFWVLVLPLKWLIAAALAAAVHEVCHFVAVLLCRGKLTGFSMTAGGAVMAAEELTPEKQLLCVLAGPAGGLLLVLTARWMPLVAICSVLLSAYNLLPVYPLDGGRALRCVLAILFSPHLARKAEAVIQTVVIILLFALSIGLGCFGLGWFAMILPMSVVLKKYSLQTGAITSTIDLA